MALVFPILFVCMPGRVGVYAYAFGYHAATVYGLMGFAAQWFNDSLFMGAVSWALLSALASVVWPLLVVGVESRSALHAGVSIAVSIVLAMLPPFALVLDGHPLVAWGYVLEGWGFIGVAVAIGLTGLIGGLLYKLRSSVLREHLLVVSVTLLGVAGAAAEVPDFKQPEGVVGVDTYFGRPPMNDHEHVERLAEIRKVINEASSENGVAKDAQIIVLPENTLNLDDSAFDFALQSEVIRPLLRAGKSAVVGKLAKSPDGTYLNQAALISSGEQQQVINQRQPAMLSMWRPWHKEHFSLDWFRDTRIQVDQDRVARVMICYEEYIPALFLLDEMQGGHDMLLLISSNWSAIDPKLPEVQRLHALGMAKMFGREVARSINYPKSFKDGQFS